MAARRILVVTYPYPPMPSVGGNRWLAMAKYLRRRGHTVEILTTSAFGGLPDDEQMRVHRSGDLIAARWLRTLMRRPPLPRQGETPAIDKPPQAMLTRVLVPDHHVVTWVPLATRMARRLIRERGYDCMITTSAYESTHLLGLGLGRNRPAWIADFRDGWTFHPWHEPFPTKLQRRIDVALERAVVRSADRTIVVERPVGEDFRSRLGVDVGYAPNGWDPELGPAAHPDSSANPGTADRPDRTASPGTADPPETSANPHRLGGGKAVEGGVTLVHTGKLTGDWGRSPGALFEAMRGLRDREPQVATRLRVVLAGRLDADELRLIADARLDGMLEHVGMLTRAEAMALQRSADVLLLITSPSLVWELPGKVFEYFGAGRPILALAHENEAARVVQETGTGWTVPPGDADAIAAALRRLVLEGARFRIDPQRLAPYVYPRPAEVVEAEVERAIAARHTRGRATRGRKRHASR
jgi:glycosyltransferase involved in cell wall biosynthesis